ncbi:MAG: glycosyltransferase family 2 protein [Actinomycetota bacterium]
MALRSAPPPARAAAKPQAPAAPSSRLTAAVAICTYTEKRWDDLAGAIGSLRKQTRAPDEIVVVVDHNPSLFARVRREFSFVVAVENRFNQGLSGARNTAVGVSSCAVMLFLDDDAEAMPNWVERAMATFSDPQVLGVGCRITGAWEGSRPQWFPPEFDWVVGCSYRGVPEQPSRIRNPLGAAMGIRRDALEATAGFRSELGRYKKIPLGCEETELCIRAGQSRPDGYFIQQPSAVVLHRVPAERQTFNYFRRRCFAEGMSKAMVGRFVGAGAGLAAERRHVMTALPAGIARGVDDAAAGDLWGFVRGAAIAIGLAFTVAGYAAGVVWAGMQSRRVRE